VGEERGKEREEEEEEEEGEKRKEKEGRNGTLLLKNRKGSRKMARVFMDFFRRNNGFSINGIFSFFFCFPAKKVFCSILFPLRSSFFLSSPDRKSVV